MKINLKLFIIFYFNRRMFFFNGNSQTKLQYEDFWLPSLPDEKNLLNEKNKKIVNDVCILFLVLKK